MICKRNTLFGNYGWSIAFLFVLFISCRKEKIPIRLPEYTPTPYTIEIPAHFYPMEIPSTNETTVEGVKLGRMLYYDKILHPQNLLSCSSCHFQKNAFSSADGVLPHINLAWSRNFLWKGNVQGELEDIMLFEVEEFMKTDLSRLQNHQDYPWLFYQAFGDTTITSENASKALAQFFRTMISGNSKYDKYLRQELMLSPEELNGYEIFFSEKGDCFHCHGTRLLTDNEFHNNGLDDTFSNSNYGRYMVTSNSSDIGKFKSPTLRNIELTAPYMHDSRYQTLEEVIDFYCEGLKISTTIDPLMKQAEDGGIQLSAQDRKDLISFLKTFTDSSFINNENLKSPF